MKIDQPLTNHRSALDKIYAQQGLERSEYKPIKLSLLWAIAGGALMLSALGYAFTVLWMSLG